MCREIRELLFYPDPFFDRKTKEKIRLVIPAAIVGIGSIAGLVTPFIRSAFDSGQDYHNVILMPDAVFLSLVLPFIAWILIAGILYTVSRLLSGTGSFVATMQNSGYGCLPLTFFLLYNIVDGIVFPEYFGTPLRVLTITRFVLGIVAILCTLWSGWLWTVAMEKTHALSRNKATIAAAITALLYASPVILNIVMLFYITGFSLG